MLLLLAIAGVVSSVTGQNVIAFSAGLSHNATYLHAETVVYDKVITNAGSGYDPSTGVFTCPTAGQYAFQYHTLAHQNKAAWLELYKNTEYIASIFGHIDSDFSMDGNSVVLDLAVGDTVYIKAVDQQYGYDTDLYGSANEIYNTFSGYLIKPVQP